MAANTVRTGSTGNRPCVSAKSSRKSCFQNICSRSAIRSKPTPKPDRTAPRTNLLRRPAKVLRVRLHRAASVTFRFAASEPSRFECKLDAGDWEECVSPHRLLDLADGEHTFSVRAVDPAGNTDANPPAATFTVNTHAPSTSIDDGPAGSDSYRRCRAKNRAASSPAKAGTPRWPPMFAWRVFSAEPKASNR